MRKPGDPIGSTDTQRDGLGGESFYGRWSRRKREERAGAPVAEPAPERADAQGAPPPRVLTDADMPALDTLGADDDYSGFLSSGVSDALRRMALRKLFSSSKFNVVDGLNDYDDDYTSFEPLGDIVTADMRHMMEVEARRARERAQAEAAEAAAAGDTAGAPADARVADAAGQDEADTVRERDATPEPLPASARAAPAPEAGHAEADREDT